MMRSTPLPPCASMPTGTIARRARHLCPRARRNAAAYLHNHNIVLTKDGHHATIAGGVKFIKEGGTIATFICAHFASPQRAAAASVSAAFLAFIVGAMP